MTAEVTFEAQEIAHKAIGAITRLVKDHERGLITGHAFQTAFYAIYDAVSGSADWGMMEPLLAAFEEERLEGKYSDRSHSAILHREGSIIILSLEGKSIRAQQLNGKGSVFVHQDEEEARASYDRKINKMSLDGYKVTNL